MTFKVLNDHLRKNGGKSDNVMFQGVDANRNWGYQFNTGGSSNDKCSDTYHGPEAFSEVENTNVR